VVELPTEAEPVRVVEGDCRSALPTLAADSFDAVVTDPPYELGFMGKAWDRTGVAFDPATWAAVLRVVKPGGYMVAMGGTRTFHRLTCAVEDAGWEIRDCLMWVYGTGFPKGRGCLKPAWEPIVLARKPGPKVLPLGIDGCRVGTSKEIPGSLPTKTGLGGYGERPGRLGITADDDGRNPDIGRYPANVVHDGSPEVMEAFAEFGERASGGRTKGGRTVGLRGNEWDHPCRNPVPGTTGTAARFFYAAKASKAERGDGNTHPTVKPLALMRWLVRLVCPAGGVLLDPFGGSGTTGKAAAAEGRSAVLIEQDAGHAETARRRVAEVMGTGLLEAARG
jgi:site-specific DNA-methyltransferase (adenine-specific)